MRNDGQCSVKRIDASLGLSLGPAGIATIVVALIHGVLGETKVFAARDHRATASAGPDPVRLAGRHGAYPLWANRRH
jgi:hypothetical protein